MAKPDSKQATETLHEIESVFDRMAHWATANPITLLAVIGGILAVLHAVMHVQSERGAVAWCIGLLATNT